MIYIGNKKLKHCFLGDEAIRKIYHGDNLLFSRSSRLPSGYTEAEYIQSSGTQYINTGITPPSISKITMDIETTDSSYSSTKYFFGCPAYVSGTIRYGLFMSIGSTGIIAASGSGNTIPTKTVTTDVSARRMLVELNAGERTASVNDVAVSLSSVTQNANMGGLCLLSFSSSASSSVRLPGKIYSVQVTKGEAVRDYVPCIDSAGSVGLYDLVEGKFYGNAGTGEFIAGPVV